MKRKLQVFVSSTFTDLIAERQAAVGAILKAGHIPAGMELFTAADQSQMEIIKRWIDESDVYMLILGGRYGSVESTSNISYTELEYDYAVQQGKPLFAVVIKEDALEKKIQLLGSSVMEKDSQKELKLFREKVLAKMSSFFADEKDIKLAVHESLSEFSQNRQLNGWVSAAQIEDTSALYEEIRVLRAENSQLKEDLNKSQSVAQSSTKINPDFRELARVLQGIEITIPATVTKGKELESDLLNIFINARDTLITGINNRHDANEYITFLYFNIAPKLIAHGLMDNEKVASVQWRRSFVSKKGLDFLAYYDRRAADSKQS